MNGTRSKRLLVASWHRGIVGGSERYLQSVIPGLLAGGYDVGVLHGYDVAPDAPTIDPRDARLSAWCVDRLGVPATLRQIAEWRPDLVYAHGLRSAEIEDALLSCYPAVIFGHDYYGTCATGNKCHRFPDPRPCARTFGPMCLLLHYPRRCGGLNPLRMMATYRLQARRHEFLARYPAVIVGSRHMCEEFKRHGVAPDRLHLAPFPVTDVQRDPNPPVARPLSGRIMMAGRLTKAKGADYLIRALPHAGKALGSTLTLSIAGTGPERAPLEDLARQLGVPAEFHGWIDAAHRVELMRSADLLAVPSLWPEPFGLVGVEAGCVGLPAVGYRVGGIPDWLVPGRTGELAPGDPPTVDGLAEAIVRALADPERHATLRRGAWETARQFTLDAHMRILEPILRSVANGES